MRGERTLKRKTRIAVSVVSGVAAAMIALAYASTVRAEADRARDEALARYGGDLVQVCVATRDIEPGETIDEGNVSVEEWVATLLPDGALTSLSDAAGKAATSRIPKRAALSSQYFKVREEAVEVPSGMVAVSVASDEEHAVGGAVGRGDKVDVYVSKDGVADRLCSARVVDTSVLAQNGGTLSWVTLGVDPKSVEELLIAASKAPITLVVPASKAASGSSASQASTQSASQLSSQAAPVSAPAPADGKDGAS